MSALDKLNNKANPSANATKDSTDKTKEVNKEEKKATQQTEKKSESSNNKVTQSKAKATAKVTKNNEASKTEISKPEPKKDVKAAKKETSPIETVSTNNEPNIKRGPGKPKKRKDGDKKISFWLDEDLKEGLYGNLKYGESAGALINEAIREYQKKHKTYKSN